MSQKIYEAMRQSIIDGEVNEAGRLAQQAIDDGVNPLDAINDGFVKGLDYVGEEFGCGEMFLPDLVLPQSMAFFGKASKTLDVIFVLCAIALGYISWTTFREQD